MTTALGRDQHTALRVAHNSLLAAHRLVHGSLDPMPASVDGIIAILRGLTLTRQDLEHRAKSLPEQVTRLRAALAHAKTVYDSAQETVGAYVALYGTPTLDGRVLQVIETSADVSRTIKYVSRAMPAYETRIVAHTQACALLATRLP